MTSAYAEAIGFLAAAITTLCWLPQTWKIVREKRTESISLSSQLAFAAGILLWLAYGVMTGSAPVVASNAVTFVLISTIVVLKLRYG